MKSENNYFSKIKKKMNKLNSSNSPDQNLSRFKFFKNKKTWFWFLGGGGL